MGVSSSVILYGQNFCKEKRVKEDTNGNMKIEIKYVPEKPNTKPPTKGKNKNEPQANKKSQDQNPKIEIIINPPPQKPTSQNDYVNCQNIITGVMSCLKEKENTNRNKLIFGCYKKNSDKNGKDEELFSCKL